MITITEADKQLKLPELPLPRGGTTYVDCSEVLWQEYGKSGQVFRKGDVVCETVGGKLHPLTPANLVGRVDQYLWPYSWKKNTGDSDAKFLKASARMHAEEAHVLLGMYDQINRHVPEVKVVTRAPVLYLHDGQLMEAAEGYNAHCKVFVTQGFTRRHRITTKQAQQALLEVLREFNFTTKGDRARAYVCFIAPAMKFGGILTGPFPMDFREADESQAGKSLGHTCVILVYNEKCYVITQMGDRGLGSFEETLSQGLVNGCPFITFDNYRGSLDLPKLESAIKGQGTVDVRVFGQGSRQVPANDCLYQMSSNGVTTTTDQANRLLIGKLVKRDLDYRYERTEDQLKAYIAANWEYLLQCVFTLIKDWWNRGQPKSDVIDHTFPEFYATMNWFAEDAALRSILSGQREEQFRVGSDAMQWLRKLSLVAVKHPEKLWTARSLETELVNTGLVERPKISNSEVPGFVARYIGQIVGAAIRRRKRFAQETFCVLDGIKIERIRSKDEKSHEILLFRFTRKTGVFPPKVRRSKG